MRSILKWYEGFIYGLGLSQQLTNIIYIVSVSIFFLIIAYTLFRVVRKLVSMVVDKYLTRSEGKVSHILANHKVYSLISYYIPLFVVYKAFFVLFPDMYSLLNLVDYIYQLANVILLCMLAFRLLSSFVDIYQLKEENKTKPIRSLIQFIQVIIVFFTVMVCISIIFKISMLTMFGSLGAASAILMLIFKDSITGLIAGMQISFNNMVKLGDWVSIDKYGVEGDVIDITLTSVKVMNFDKTISTIPAYNFVASDSVQNWQGMIEFGGRRIKRAVSIDVNTVVFCTKEMLKGLKEIDLVKNHIEEAEKEFTLYNEDANGSIVNKKNLTNLGLFRAYLLAYLQNHESIHKEASLMVRQIEPTANGATLEIYCFTNTTVLSQYEDIQSGIFDHIFAAIPYFGLKIYQAPNGKDFMTYFEKK